MGVPPSKFRGRPAITSYSYDDQGRLVRAVQASEWTVEDRALMLARQQYLATLCPGCAHPKGEAHHPDNEGWYKQHLVTCHACTAQRSLEVDGVTQPVEYAHAVSDRDYELKPLPPFPRSIRDV